MADVRKLVLERSTGRCEAMVQLARTWTRCGRLGIEDHHMLTRARGGDLLDTVDEVYHHVALCPKHHREAHSEGFKTGLMLEGSAYLLGGVIVYVGPDEYLSEHYPRSASLG